MSSDKDEQHLADSTQKLSLDGSSSAKPASSFSLSFNPTASSFVPNFGAAAFVPGAGGAFSMVGDDVEEDNTTTLDEVQPHKPVVPKMPKKAVSISIGGASKPKPAASTPAKPVEKSNSASFENLDAEPVVKSTPAKPAASTSTAPVPEPVAAEVPEMTAEEKEAEEEFYNEDGKEHLNIVFIGHVGTHWPSYY